MYCRQIYKSHGWYGYDISHRSTLARCHNKNHVQTTWWSEYGGMICPYNINYILTILFADLLPPDPKTDWPEFVCNHLCGLWQTSPGTVGDVDKLHILKAINPPHIHWSSSRNTFATCVSGQKSSRKSETKHLYPKNPERSSDILRMGLDPLIPL